MQIQISWLLQKPTDLDLHCLQNRVYLGSAGQGLNVEQCDKKRVLMPKANMIDLSTISYKLIIQVLSFLYIKTCYELI